MDITGLPDYYLLTNLDTNFVVSLLELQSGSVIGDWTLSSSQQEFYIISPRFISFYLNNLVHVCFSSSPTSHGVKLNIIFEDILAY